jgi:DNA-binding cell septation regulator SpoVG
MKIEIVSLRLIGEGRTLRGFADVKIGDILIRDFRIMQNGGRAYVRAPFSTYKNNVGEIQFRQIIDLPDEVRGQVDTLILSTFYREKEKEDAEKSKR